MPANTSSHCLLDVRIYRYTQAGAVHACLSNPLVQIHLTAFHNLQYVVVPTQIVNGFM